MSGRKFANVAFGVMIVLRTQNVEMMMPCARQHLEISSQDPVFLWGVSLNLAQLEWASLESEELPDTRKWYLTRPR
ncbi:hypothetical protein LA080_007177 [Diaporthe eres]|nr:hypothetical protein LA080_007177 [Diaporthe eres]